MSNVLIDQINEKLSKELLQHLKWRVMITKDICYTGKVLKIIITDMSNEGPTNDINIDLRYTPQSITIIAPLQNLATVEEFNDYIQTQLYVAIQQVNEIMNR